MRPVPPAAGVLLAAPLLQSLLLLPPVCRCNLCCRYRCQQPDIHSCYPNHRFIHEYQLTPHSLYAAVSIGLECGAILGVLARLSKNVLPPQILEFVRECTQNYGKVRLCCSSLSVAVLARG